MKPNTPYEIDLHDPNLRERTFEYTLDDAFFGWIDGIIERGNIRTTVACTQAGSGVFGFRIHSTGIVIQPCDHCLGDLQIPIDDTTDITVKLGDSFDDDGHVITVSAQDAVLDLSIPIYESIALSLPIRCVHEPGMCDAEMEAQISEHLVARGGTEQEEDKDERHIDARWDILKSVINNNN